jgi:rhamnulokinase
VTSVVAVDFGATSVRVCRVDLGCRPPRVDVVHRAEHAPVRDGAGSLRWDWTRLVDAMVHGIELARAAGPVASIGIDTWAVDYGLLDGGGRLVAPPFSYRDDRTRDYRAIVERFGERRLYETTGVQLQPFNTLFQVACHPRDELARARRLLFLPELLAHHLTGVALAERTSAGCSALVDLSTGTWSGDLCSEVGLDPALLPAIHPATTRVGSWRGSAVHLVGGHDTASAVTAAGSAMGPRSAFVATGTWLLVGREQPEPDTSEAARRANFTNEPAALGGFLHLRNVAGFWLLERCREQWGTAPVAELLAAAEHLDRPVPAVDATDEAFLNPSDMVGAITEAAGLRRDSPPPVVVRCIVESLASTTASVLADLGDVDDVRMIGGGVQAGLLRRRLSEITGVVVRPGPVEAAALGNALVQGIALGVYQDLDDARRSLEPADPQEVTA